MAHTPEIDIELAESCVQALGDASGTGCELCDPDGNPAAVSGFSCDVCEICAGTGILREDCKKLHAFTAKASEREDGKYIYECPLGFSCVTSAVPAASGRLFRLTLGPFLMEDAQDFRDYDLKGDISPALVEKIMDRMRVVPYMDPKRVNAFSQLLVCSAAFLSAADRKSEDYLTQLEEGTVNAWAKANRIDPSGMVRLVNEFIEENYGSDISLLDIARHVGMTTSYLCRLYKRECGTTVNAYLTQVRIERSKALLADGVAIAEAARLCGFSDQSYFTKVFRQIEGTTPLKYKKTV